MKWQFRRLRRLPRRVVVLPQAHHPYKIECPDCGAVPTMATKHLEWCLVCGWKEER